MLIEPSGIYDVDEFFGVMDEDVVRKGCEIGCVLTIVDAGMPEALSGESEYLMCTQLLAAGTVILSKTQLREPDAPAKTVERLNALIASFGGGRVLREVCAKNWDDLTDADFEAFGRSGYSRAGHSRVTMDHEQVYAACITAGFCRDEKDLSERISRDLKRRGFRYVGPVTIYSHLQACGIVNDHDATCPCRAKLIAAYPTGRKRRGGEVPARLTRGEGVAKWLSAGARGLRELDVRREGGRGREGEGDYGCGFQVHGADPFQESPILANPRRYCQMAARARGR